MDSIHSFSTQLLYTDFCRAGREWQYQNIISPFTRIYLVTDGGGAIYINNERYELSPGTLFIVPKFTLHSYECDEFIEHYYICFFDEMIGERSIYDIIEFQHKLQSSELDYALFRRIVEINSNMGVPDHDPRRYNNQRQSLPFNAEQSISNILKNTENSGIVMQILSRFFAGCKIKTSSEMEGRYHRLTALVNHINNNLSTPLKCSDLASYMNLSPDHFARVFKSIMGISSKEYLQKKRIERAQALLMTSRFSIQDVAIMVGIPNISQFSTLFKRVTNQSPRQYLKKQVETMSQKSLSREDSAKLD